MEKWSLVSFSHISFPQCPKSISDWTGQLLCLGWEHTLLKNRVLSNSFKR